MSREFFLKRLFSYSVPIILSAVLISNILRVDNILNGYFQVDFSADYSASLARLERQNPYSFTYQRAGLRFEHSEFLQPPIVSDIFVPLAFLSYHDAKQAWFLVEICLFFLCLLLVTRRLGISFLLITAFLSGVPTFFWPVFVHLERGQTDLLVLFFICLGYFFWRKSKPIQAGIFLCIAGFLKLPAFLLFLVPLFAREKKALFSGIVAAVLILLISIVVDGVALNRNYVFVYLPSILKTEMLPVDVFNLGVEQQHLNTGEMDWGGYSYTAVLPVASTNGSVSRFVSQYFGTVLGRLTYRLGFVLVFVIGLVFVRRTRDKQSGFPEYMFDIIWPFMMASILVFHPLTWVMSYVWSYVIVILTTRFWKVAQMRMPILALFFVTSIISLDDAFFWRLTGTVATLTHNPDQALMEFITSNRIWMCGLAVWLILLIVLIFMKKTSDLDRVVHRSASL